MVVIGGASNRLLKTESAAYNPALRRWRLLPPSPAGFLAGQSAVWTGSSILLWGGTEGLALDPMTGAWSRLSPAPLSERSEHSAVWTGSEMIVWGGEGCQDGCYRADGARY
jgi:hypothetical protein